MNKFAKYLFYNFYLNTMEEDNLFYLHFSVLRVLAILLMKPKLKMVIQFSYFYSNKFHLIQ